MQKLCVDCQINITDEKIQVIRCPLHDAAPNLLLALETAIGMIDMVRANPEKPLVQMAYLKEQVRKARGIMSNEIHQSKVGTFHPNPASKVVWTVNDTTGTIDAGPACDECGACECEWCGCPSDKECHPESMNRKGVPFHSCECEKHPCRDGTDGEYECIGLSFAVVCLDGGDSLCLECAEQEGIEIVGCDCES